MHSPVSLKLERWMYLALAGIVTACAAYFLVVFLYIVLSRIHYPFALDWVEGESLVQVQRILHGQALYARPGYQYVALTYPPLYYYVAAVFARLMGFGFFPLRLVSLLSSLGCIALIYLICRGERTGLLPAVIAAGFFTAAYGLSGYWFDIGRIDMLGVFLVLLSVYLLRQNFRFSIVLSGLAVSLACLTKQTNLLTLILLGAYCLLFDRRRSVGFLLSSLGSFGAISLLLDRLYGGWYTFFVFASPIGTGGSASITPLMILRSIPEFWLRSIFLVMPIAALFAVAFIVLQLRQPQERKILYFYAFGAAGMLGTSWASLVHVGGYKNDLIPGLAIIAILVGLALQRLLQIQRFAGLIRIPLLAACTVQFVALYFPAAPQIPTAADLDAGNSLIAELREQPGSVYVPFHPELPLMAGKPALASWNAMYQLEGGYGGGDSQLAARVKTEFANAMRKHEFSIIILDRDLNWVWGHPEQYYYFSAEPVFSDPDVFWPVTGWQNRPTSKMYPIP